MPELRATDQGNSNLSKWWLNFAEIAKHLHYLQLPNSTNSDIVYIYLLELVWYIPQTHSETKWYSNYSDWLVFWILLALIGEAG